MTEGHDAPRAEHVPRQAGLRAAWLALALTTYSQAGVAVLSQSIGPLAPFLQAEWDLSRGEIGLGVSLLYLGNMLTTIPGGRACDIWGERPILILSGTLAGLAALIGSRSPVFPLLLVTLFIIGMGNGLQAPAGSAAVISWFPRTRRGLAFGIRQTGLPAGAAIASVVIPWVSLATGWRIAWAILAAIAVSGALVVLFGYRERREHEARSAGGGARSMREVLADRNLRVLTFYSFTHLVAQFSATSFFVIFAHEVLGYSVVTAGVLFAIASVIALASRVFWGGASDILTGGDRRSLLLIVSVISIGACLLGAGLAVGLPQWLVFLLVLALGTSTLAWTGLQIALASELAGRSTTGTAVGLVLGISGTGILVGPPLFGLLVDRTGSYLAAWLAVAAILAAGTYCLRFVDRPTR